MTNSKHDRAMKRNHYGTVLGVLGDRAADTGDADERDRILDAAAILIPPARRAGLSITDIREALGLASLDVVELQRRRGSSQHAHLRVLALLGTHGGLRVEQAASMLGWDVPWATEMFDVLAQEESIGPAITGYDAPEPAFWHLTDRGEAELRYESARLGYPELTRYAAYLAISEAEASALHTVAARRLGGEVVTVLTPRHTPAVRDRELAFSVFATSPEAAAEAADRIFRELLTAAELPSRPAVFADLAPIAHPGVAA
jgi:hypothetical protein